MPSALDAVLGKWDSVLTETPPEVLVPNLKQTAQEAGEIARAETELWLGGKEPLPFDEFAQLLDGSKLTPRQYKVFADTNMLRAASWVKADRKLNEIILMWGKGAGKGYTSAKLCAYLAYVVKSMTQDPASYITRLNPTPLARGTKLDIVNVAPNEELAKTVFFRYLQQFISHPIFTPFSPKILGESVQFYPAGEIEAAKKANRPPNYTLGIFSKNSRGSGLDGFNLLFWFMDEADAFLSTENHSNAEEIHRIFRSSASTRMGNCWTGVVASYPRVEDGFMVQTYNRAVKNMAEFGPDASYYGDKAATWEVRTGVDREHVAAIEEDYQNDPTDAASKYECSPMNTVDAFFEFPERIISAVDDERAPIAYVSYEPLELPHNNGGVSYFLKATLSDIRRHPGHSYFLGGDAGEKGDAYTLAVFHTEDGGSAHPYLCPECGDDPMMRSTAVYKQLPLGTRFPWDENLFCGVCYRTSIEFFGMMAGMGTMRMDGFWQRSDLASKPDGVPIVKDAGGLLYDVPHVYEDLIVRIKPKRATRKEEHNILVYFPSVVEVCDRLIKELGIEKSRFDPHMTQECRQRLLDSTGADVDEISFSNPEQYRRARLAKAMLYADKITLLGKEGSEHSETRDTEWKRLHRVARTNRVDHPVGGSKDIFDAESVAIWCAATSKCAQLAVTWA